MDNDLEFFPYIGLGQIRFGMTAEEVRKILGEPLKTIKLSHRKVRELRKDIIIIYSLDDSTVEEISCLPEAKIYYEGKSLMQDNVINDLKTLDNEIYESNGIIIFLNLGVAITGFHDYSDSQKNITLFKKGCWDQFKSKLKPYVQKTYE